ncbi:hypothetical protein LJK87_34405 [Paenibacillus sp. P25]|nr:hypothetical protein LJK87_34405 [Paenibacillus sp. P25]
MALFWSYIGENWSYLLELTYQHIIMVALGRCWRSSSGSRSVLLPPKTARWEA